MQPLDADDLVHGVIVITREELICHHAAEFEHYSNPKAVASWFDVALCAYCARSSGTKGFVDDDHLSIEWKSLLSICQYCRVNGALPLARTRRWNNAVNMDIARNVIA